MGAADQCRLHVTNIGDGTIAVSDSNCNRSVVAAPLLNFEFSLTPGASVHRLLYRTVLLYRTELPRLLAQLYCLAFRRLAFALRISLLVALQ
jgi:hypothetical protein